MSEEKKPTKRAREDGDDKEDHYDPATTTMLFVSNLPYSATTTDLTTHFSDIGPVRSAFVVLDRETKKSKGVGYVSYAMREDADRAVEEMNGGSFGDGKGRRLGVEFAGKRPALVDPESNEPPAPKIKKPRPALPSQSRTTHISEDSPSGPSTHASSSSSSDPKAIRTLIVSNLPEGLTKAVLWKKIRKVGEVEELVYPVEGGDMSIAHVVFPSAALAQAAVPRLHAHTYKERTLSCVLKKVIDKLEASGKDGALSKGSRLIIRNLPWDTTSQTLHSIFLPHGPIHSITLPPPLPAPKSADPDKPSKPRARGFAFVWMVTRKDAEKALEAINGTTIVGENKNEEQGRVAAVDWALSKDKWKEAEGKAEAAAPAEEKAETTEGEKDAEGDVNMEEKPEGIEIGESGEMMVPAEEEEEEKEEEAVKPALPAPEEGSTLFIRNLSFEATEDQLRLLFRTYGPLRYAKITMDRATGRSRGTGFVCFWKKEDADRAVEQARLMSVETGSGANSVPVRNRAANPFAAPSILTVDPSSSLAANLVMHGRVLDVEVAVTRDQAAKLKEEGDRRKEKVDKRNTYLMREGVIFPNTPAAATLAPNELEKRTDSFNSRKTLLTSNPSLYISKTRLSIRQLPLFCTDRTLKRLAIHASREFDNEVKAGTREGLDEEESRDGTLSPAVAKAEESGKGGKNKGKKERTTVVIQAKVVRANDRVDALSGLGKSKGYGFLEMRTHQDALKVLRWANNNPTVENLMREWWTVELAEVIERTKGELDEARLAELKIASGEIPAPKEPEDEGPMNEKKKKKGKAKAEAEEAEKDGEVGEKKKSQKKEKVELAELETRLRRLTEKAKELKELMDAGREVVMKKTLIVEFSIENVQVVQRRVSKVGFTPRDRDSGHASSSNPRDGNNKRKHDSDSFDASSSDKKRPRSGPPAPGGQNRQYRDRKGDGAKAGADRGGEKKTSGEKKGGGDGGGEGSAKKEGGERNGLGSLIGKKRKERKQKGGA